MSPIGFEIAGDSIGLALALACRAACCGVSLSDLIATGSVGPTANAPIRHVDGAGEKRAAVTAFRAGQQVRVISFLFPSGVSLGHDQQFVQQENDIPATTLEDLFKNLDGKCLLLDGFYLAQNRASY